MVVDPLGERQVIIGAPPGCAATTIGTVQAPAGQDHLSYGVT
jgi:hypothetical protein